MQQRPQQRLEQRLGQVGSSVGAMQQRLPGVIPEVDVVLPPEVVVVCDDAAIIRECVRGALVEADTGDSVADVVAFRDAGLANHLALQEFLQLLSVGVGQVTIFVVPLQGLLGG